MTTKPKYPFCWFCSRRFRGRHHEQMETEAGVVLVHKQCRQEMEK